MIQLSHAARGRLNEIEQSILPLRIELLEHPVYDRLENLDALRCFMQYHVFAVWDFMSLLKALQQRMTCVSIPWVPPENREACRLVNEIVLGEESDLDPAGRPASHFDLYLESMRTCQAPTPWIDQFLNRVRIDGNALIALNACDLPQSIRTFVGYTFSVIRSDDVCAIASAFTFGREDLLPGVFQRIVEHLDAGHGGILANFRYYLDRHIQLDADEHGPMAAQLIASLCGEDEERWACVLKTAKASLEQRLALWDGILAGLG